jgi:adenylate cyclase
MPQEIERKFLVRSDHYKQKATLVYKIAQGYLSSQLQRSVRVRIREERAFLTIKGESNAAGITRFEWEKEISVADAEELMKICEPGIIEKIRYEVPGGDHTFEVDEFSGANDGLVVAEIELHSEDEEFNRPEWLGAEVTGDPKYYNSMLARHPYKDWQ